MHIECAIILLQLVTAHTRFIPGGFNATTVDRPSDHIVEETQHATCKISSKDLEATANASITRQLKGICTSAHLDTRMNILERTLVLEINNIKSILLQHTPTQDVKQRLPGNRSNLRSFTNDQSLQTNTETMVGRDAEITRCNMTIHKDNSTGIKFIYYWRIHNILDEIKSTGPIDSSDFYFSGNHLYIRVFPNYKHTEHTFIQAVGIEDFQLAHEFTVLDQSNAHYDIVSPLLRCDRQVNQAQVQCAGYQISHEILASRDIVMNDNLVIKLVIFLEI
ncbi:hypothetical protein CBL_07686 [Carabus blaptoides fortunei]